MYSNKKRVTFAPRVTYHRWIESDDRRNFMVHDTERFRTRIRQAEIILKPVLLKKIQELSRLDELINSLENVELPTNKNVPCPFPLHLNISERT